MYGISQGLAGHRAPARLHLPPPYQFQSNHLQPQKQDPPEKAINSAANTVGWELGRQIVRGLFGMFRKQKRRKGARR